MLEFLYEDHTFSVVKQKGMVFGFQKTATAVTGPERWMDGWVGGWMDGWMDGWVDGWMRYDNVDILEMSVFEGHCIYYGLSNRP